MHTTNNLFCVFGDSYASGTQNAGCRMQGNKITGLEYKLCEEREKKGVKFSVNINFYKQLYLSVLSLQI